MKERPILFSAPMVRAILAGTKTQTRRIVKKQFAGTARIVGDCVAFIDNGRRAGPDQRCPYGQPGDRLWVRETWASNSRGDILYYRADCQQRGADWVMSLGEGSELCIGRWQPSIHMPRWASRITLEITGVRVERLQDISEQDAMAEGAEPYRLPCRPQREALRHVDGFHTLWESINGPGSWERNPLVRVVEFWRVTP